MNTDSISTRTRGAVRLDRVVWLLLLVVALPIKAQVVGRVVVAGQVNDSAGAPIAGADVLLTRAVRFDTFETTTDARGTFRIVLDADARDFLINVLANGFSAARTRAQLAAGEDSVYVTLRLVATAGVAMQAVVVQSTIPRPRDLNSDLGARGGAAEQLISETIGVLAGTEAGDLGLAGELNPTLVLGGSGIGALGLGGEQSRVTINGLPTSSLAVPIGLRRRIRAGTTNYDPAVGGFSGASVQLDLTRGSTLSLPRLHVARDGDPAGFVQNSSGSVTGSQSMLSLSASGQDAPGRFAYNAAVTVNQRAQTTPLLGDALSSPLRARGVQDTDLERLTAGATARAVPFDPATQRQAMRTNVDALGRVDVLSSPFGKFAVTIGGTYGDGETVLGILDNATQGLQSRTRGGSVQLSNRTAPSRGWVFDWRVGGSRSSNEHRPRNAGAAVVVRLPSDSSNQLLARLGGIGQGVAARRRHVIESSVQAERVLTREWFGRHQLNVFAQQQTDLAEATQSVGAGAWTFESLEAFERGTPRAYSRTATPLERGASATNFALGASDVWRPSRFLTLQVGARVDAGGPNVNRDVDDRLAPLLGPRRVVDGPRFRPLVSPRVGFTWSYRGTRTEQAALLNTSLGSSAMLGHGIIRGGIGLFRSYWDVSELLLADAATRAPGELLLCGAGQLPDFAWLPDPTGAPTACAGAAPIPARAGAVVLGRDIVPPSAWRGNLAVSHALWNRITVEAGVLLSSAFGQRFDVDRNLPTVPAFLLASEGNRPSLRSLDDLDAATGRPLRDVPRVVPALGPVVERLGTGRTDARQLTVSVQPDLKGPWQLKLGSAFTHATERVGGLVSSGAEPLSSAVRGRVPTQPTVRSVLEFARVGQRYSLSGVVRHTTGVRYTPRVDGDVNGDGDGGNDRAYIRASYLDALQRSGVLPRHAHRCLASQVEAIARIASCTGPSAVRADLALTMLPNPTALMARGGGRATWTLRLLNATALLDRLVHREAAGWGGVTAVDPVLLRVNGFDPLQRAFRYEPNSGFGRPVFNRVDRFAPYRIVLEAQLFLGQSVADQSAVRTLHASRLRRDPRERSDVVFERLQRTYADPYDDVLALGDSLLLQRAQVEEITRLQGTLRSRVDSVWRHAAEDLVSPALRDDAREAGARLQVAYDEVAVVLREGVRPLQSLLVEGQLRRLPSSVSVLLSGGRPLLYLREE